MELDKDLAARQEARLLCRQAEQAQKLPPELMALFRRKIGVIAKHRLVYFYVDDKRYVFCRKRRERKAARVR